MDEVTNQLSNQATKIYLAADHAGFQLKEAVKKFLTDEGYQIEDLGNFKYDENDDYPDFVSKAAEAVGKCSAGHPDSPAGEEGSRDSSASPQNDGCRAIIIGGSGQGEAMVANRYKGVRAAVYYGEPSFAEASKGEKQELFNIIKLSREHNDANVLSIGARFLKEKDALKAIKLWLETPFSGEERHKRRLDKF